MGAQPTANIYDAILAAQRAKAAEAEAQANEPGIVGTALDYLNRPYSAVIGTLEGLATGKDWTRNLEKALTGEKHYGAADLLEAAGADPESNWTKWGGLALDVFPGGFLDPLTPLTLGANKLGKVAKVAGKFPTRLMETGNLARVAENVPDLAKAAREGLWGPSYLGMPIAPRKLSEYMAKAVQGTGDYIKGRTPEGTALEGVKKATSGVYRTLRPLVGGRVKTYEDFFKDLPGMKMRLDENQQQSVKTIVDIYHSKSPETRELMSYFREQPILAERALAGDKRIAYTVPKDMSKEEWDAFLSEMLPFAKYAQTPDEAFRDAALTVLPDLGRTLMNNPVRKVEAVRLSRFADFFPSGSDQTEIVDNILQSPDLRGMMAKHLGPDYEFAGIVPAHMLKDANGADKALLAYLNKTKTPKGRASTNGTPWLTADELLTGKSKDPVILLSRPHSLDAIPPPLRKDRQQTLAIFSKLADFSARGGNLRDWNAVKQLSKSPKLKTVWDAMNDAIYEKAAADLANPFPNATGTVRRVFHGTPEPNPINVFNENSIDPTDTHGFFFTDSAKEAEWYANERGGVDPVSPRKGAVGEYFVNLKNPASLDIENTAREAQRGNGPDLELGWRTARQLEEWGHDGVDRGNGHYIVFDTSQIRPTDSVKQKTWGQYATMGKEWALLRAHGDKAMEWQWKHDALQSIIDDRVAKLNQLNLPTAPDAPFSIIDNERKIKLVEELDALRAEQRDPALFGRADKLRQTILDNSRPPITASKTEERILELGQYSPEVVSDAARTIEELKPVFDTLQKGWSERGIRFGRDQETYLQHFPKGLVQTVREPKNIVEAELRREQFKSALVERIGMESPWLDPEEVAKRAEIEIAKNSPAFSKMAVGTGRYDPLVHRREYDVPILVYNALHPDRPFETDIAKIMSEEYRVASNYWWGFDAYKHLTDNYAGRFARKIADPKDVPQGWSKIQYHIPFGNKDPFENWYAPKELLDRMKSSMRAVKELSSDPAMSNVLALLHAARREWASFTLAPFPSYHLRNFGGNITFAQMGGLDIRTPRGWKAWAAGFGAVAEKRGHAALQSWADDLNAAYKTTEFTADNLRKVMKANNVIGVGLRDLDWDNHGDEIMAALEKGKDAETRRQRAFRWIHPDYRKNKVVEKGFKFGRKNEDTARAALFLHRMLSNADATTDVQRAITEATAHTKKYMLDYTDLTDAEQKYMKLFFPFYCVPTSHEILTREGWKRHDQLKIGEDVMTYDVQTQNLRWEPLLDIARFDFNGTLKKISRRSGEWLCTDDHRWPVEQIETRKKNGKRYGGQRKIVRTHELNTAHKIPLTGDYTEQSSILTPRAAAILGWVVADGYFRWREGHCEMLVYQHPRKYLKEVEALLENTRRKPHPDTGVCAVSVRRGDIENLTRVFRGKGDLPRIVGKLSREAADAMYDAMMKAEGCTSDIGQEFFAQCPDHNPEIRDAFQMLALMTGRSANLNGRGAYIRKQKFLWAKNKAGGKQGIEDVYYSGRIWCPKTPSGTWVMRNEGSTIITGNTFSSKAVPLMMGEFVRNPGKFQYLNRAYHGAWSGYDEELEPEDIPEFMQRDLRIPMRKVGNEYVMFTGKGWFPASELIEIAQAFTDHTSFAQYFISKMAPILKDGFEIALNRNAFTGEDIEQPGRVKDFLSVTAGPAWAKHLLENVRVLSELDRANPGGIWTKLGQMRGLWQDERPHRNEAPGPYRALQFGFGLNFKDIDPSETLRKSIGRTQREMNEAKAGMQYAIRRGAWAERDAKLAIIQEKQRELRALADRLAQRQRYTAAHLNGNQ